MLQAYLGGKLSAQDMFQVERHALEDPFVAEALEGLSHSPEHSLEGLSLLQKQLHARVAEQTLHKKESVITWQRLSVAATAAVLFIAISTMFWMKSNTAREDAKQQAKGTVVATYDAGAVRPKGGYIAYQQYLEKNNTLKDRPVEDEVTLTFNVQADGKPADIQIVASPGQLYSDEAIRLLREGPLWETPNRANERVSLSLSFNKKAQP